MKGRINNKFGSIQIDPEVIAMYAGTTAVECFGIVGMAAVSMKDGLVKLLKRDSLTLPCHCQLWCKYFHGRRQSDRECKI